MKYDKKELLNNLKTYNDVTDFTENEDLDASKNLLKHGIFYSMIEDPVLQSENFEGWAIGIYDKNDMINAIILEVEKVPTHVSYAFLGRDGESEEVIEEDRWHFSYLTVLEKNENINQEELNKLSSGLMLINDFSKEGFDKSNEITDILKEKVGISVLNNQPKKEIIPKKSNKTKFNK
jgi:hypothetical protein